MSCLSGGCCSEDMTGVCRASRRNRRQGGPASWCPPGGVRFLLVLMDGDGQVSTRSRCCCQTEGEGRGREGVECRGVGEQCKSSPIMQSATRNNVIILDYVRKSDICKSSDGNMIDYHELPKNRASSRVRMFCKTRPFSTFSLSCGRDSFTNRPECRKQTLDCLRGISKKMRHSWFEDSVTDGFL